MLSLPAGGRDKEQTDDLNFHQELQEQFGMKVYTYWDDQELKEALLLQRNVDIWLYIH